MKKDNSAIRELLKDSLSRSTCYKHPVAAVIQTEYDYVLGWNGAPFGIKHSECSRKGYASGEGFEKCPTIHAERRAISRAAKQGISLFNSTIYLNEWFPCADCAKSIIEAGIKRLVTPDEFYSDITYHILLPKLQNQPYNFEMAEKLMRESGIEIIVDETIRP